MEGSVVEMGSKRNQHRQQGVLSAFRHAYLDTVLARASWRAAQDCEAQVAHWVYEGVANHADLLEAREVVHRARQVHGMALSRYNHLLQMAATQAGARAGAEAAQAAQAARLRESMRKAG
jgi:hypothetical protein